MTKNELKTLLTLEMKQLTELLALDDTDVIEWNNKTAFGQIQSDAFRIAKSIRKNSIELEKLYRLWQ